MRGDEAEWSFAAEGLFCYTFRRKEAQVLSWKEKRR